MKDEELTKEFNEVRNLIKKVSGRQNMLLYIIAVVQIISLIIIVG